MLKAWHSAENADGNLLVLKIPIDGGEGHRCVKIIALAWQNCYFGGIFWNYDSYHFKNILLELYIYGGTIMFIIICEIKVVHDPHIIYPAMEMTK